MRAHDRGGVPRRVPPPTEPPGECGSAPHAQVPFTSPQWISQQRIAAHTADHSALFSRCQLRGSNYWYTWFTSKSLVGALVADNEGALGEEREPKRGSAGRCRQVERVAGEAGADGQRPERLVRRTHWLTRRCKCSPNPSTTLASAEDGTRHPTHQIQLGPLLGLRQFVPLHRGGKAALRAEREPLQGNDPGGIVDASL